MAKIRDSQWPGNKGKLSQVEEGPGQPAGSLLVTSQAMGSHGRGLACG